VTTPSLAGRRGEDIWRRERKGDGGGNIKISLTEVFEVIED
jgi:hypothetical protein